MAGVLKVRVGGAWQPLGNGSAAGVAPHHATHDVGGSDPITALDGSVITTGKVAAARLTPAGGSTQVQFNDAGVLAGGAGLTYDKANGSTHVVGSLVRGPTPASAGAVALTNTDQVVYRNAAGTQDIQALTVHSDDKVYVGAFANDAGLTLRSSSRIDVSRGITFPVSPVLTGDPTTLDDYREGQWSATIIGAGGSSGQTYGYQRGDFVKFGSFVWVNCRIALAVKGTITGQVGIGNLPFLAYDTGGLDLATPIFYFAMATPWSSLCAIPQPNAAYALIYGGPSAGTYNVGAVSGSDLTDTTELRWSCVYRTAQ